MRLSPLQLVRPQVICVLSWALSELWATFKTEAGGMPWMILEDVGNRYADRCSSRDRSAFLQALGWLHGRGLRLAASDSFADTPIPHFSESHLGYGEWEGLLQLALRSTRYCLEGWVVPLWNCLWGALQEQPETLLHGDTDYSNAVMSDGGVALVDWERACIGLASVDVGRALQPTRSVEEIESYRVAYCDAAGTELTSEEVRLIADMGLAHNSLRWICYYVKRIVQKRDPGVEWRHSGYDPCLEQLRRVHHRHPGWSRGM